jgi:hypothetical protein
MSQIKMSVLLNKMIYLSIEHCSIYVRSHHGHDRMVIGFTTTFQ